MVNTLPSEAERKYTGFDISAQHFPETPLPNSTFEVQDILTPFPEAFHNQFDLVHVRLLVLALRKDQFEPAVKNVMQLLKPGGWIQWEEFEAINLDFIPSSEITRLVQSISRNIARSANLSNTPCADLHKILSELDCEDVRFIDYDSRGRADLVEDAREWTKAGGKAGLFPALLRDGTGKSVEEARAAADELYKTWAATIDAGVEPTMPFGRVVGRKPASK
jgi:SAM-dependent methyltransferase